MNFWHLFSFLLGTIVSIWFILLCIGVSPGFEAKDIFKTLISLTIPASILIATHILNKRTREDTKKRDIIIDLIGRTEQKQLEFMVFLQGFWAQEVFIRKYLRDITLFIKGMDSSLEVLKEHAEIELLQAVQDDLEKINDILTGEWGTRQSIQYSNEQIAQVRKLDSSIAQKLTRAKFDILEQ